MKTKIILIYASKRPLDKENTFFRKKTQINEKKNENINKKNINLNMSKDINGLINEKISPREEKKTITIESTILDENDELIGRNIPH